MDLIICHTAADFDTLGAAVGLSCLLSGGRIVLPGEAHPAVHSFLALHRDEYALIEQRAVTLSMIRSITLVDCHRHHRLGAAQPWIDHAIAGQLPMIIYGHHDGHPGASDPDIPGKYHIEAVGATSTLVVESLRQAGHTLSPTKATVMALGIHRATGSLTMAQTTPRDALALAWLMEQGAHPICQTWSDAQARSIQAQDVMSSPVRTIHPSTPVADAQGILLRYGHSGLCVADEAGQLQGIISRRDIDLALHHGLNHSPVKGYMAQDLKTVQTYTSIHDIQGLMVTYDVGRLPVLDGETLVGIVTRTDVLRQVYPALVPKEKRLGPVARNVYERLQTSLQTHATALESEDLWTLLNQMAAAAQARGWHLYLVGGAVRDLLLAADDTQVFLKDIDLVVDSFRTPVVDGAGVALAQQLQQQYPEAELQVHGDFQTAALIWPSRDDHTPLMIDIATARTEFYPYPAANPEVEPSSIGQDLYRRDFTINALAVRLTSPQPGLLLDFFGGALDIQRRRVRVLHANSFIEDPTRIFRAVRFAVRLGFTLDAQTEIYIRYALDSGIYGDLQARQNQRLPALQSRLKAELTYIFQADYWSESLGLLDQLGALSCLHSSLSVDPNLWRQLHRVDRWHQKFTVALGKDVGVPLWLSRLEVLLAAVEMRSHIAQQLQLPQSSSQRLQQLIEVETHLLSTLGPESTASKIYQTLAPYDLPTLLLVSVRHPKLIGHYVWVYLTCLMQVRPPVDGHHLKQMGYAPGPLYREILTALTHATLDGDIVSLASAEAYLHRHYPLEVIDT